MTFCKSCDAPIRWVKMPASGKLMPLDDQPVEDGNIIVMAGDGYILTAEQAEMYRGPRFKSHFATCPSATEHRL